MQCCWRDLLGLEAYCIFFVLVNFEKILTRERNLGISWLGGIFVFIGKKLVLGRISIFFYVVCIGYWILISGWVEFIFLFYMLIWWDVHGLSAIGTKDNFFYCGHDFFLWYWRILCFGHQRCIEKLEWTVLVVRGKYLIIVHVHAQRRLGIDSKHVVVVHILVF